MAKQLLMSKCPDYIIADKSTYLTNIVAGTCTADDNECTLIVEMPLGSMLGFPPPPVIVTVDQFPVIPSAKCSCWRWTLYEGIGVSDPCAPGSGKVDFLTGVIDECGHYVVTGAWTWDEVHLPVPYYDAYILDGSIVYDEESSCSHTFVSCEFRRRTDLYGSKVYFAAECLGPFPEPEPAALSSVNIKSTYVLPTADMQDWLDMQTLLKALVFHLPELTALKGIDQELVTAVQKLAEKSAKGGCSACGMNGLVRMAHNGFNRLNDTLKAQVRGLTTPS